MTVKELIQNVEDLKVHLNEVSVYDLDVHTSLDLYYTIAKKFNVVIKELSRFEGVISDEVIKQNEKLVYLLGEGLNTEVVNKINQMVADGTMDTIINHNVFNSLNNKIENYKEELNSQIKDIPNNIFKLIYERRDLHLWGHRCMQEVAPENTLIGVIKAKEYGFKGVEFDVHKTCDNILVVHHDDTVDRMTDGTGRISSMTLSQIKNLNIDTGNNIELYENLKIPTLEEMLIEVKKNDLFAMIHIYDGDANEVLRLINKYRLNMRVVISSYDTNLLKEIRALDPQIALSKIAGSNPIVDIPIAVELGNCMIGISWYAVTTENIELAHSNNLIVVTDTCFNLNRYNEIKSKNIDIVLSDILI